MHYFNKVTGAILKDCFIDDNDTVVFVVAENEFGKAVGKGGVKSRKLESIIKKTESFQKRAMIIMATPSARPTGSSPSRSAPTTRPCAIPA
mgnify:CR=1 FL=1